jgi:hypothetical protein
MSSIFRHDETRRPGLRLAAVVVLGFLALLLRPEAVSTRPAWVAEGIWVGALNLGGSPRSLVLALDERSDGRLIGYLLGGTGQRTVVSGRRTERDVVLEIEMKTLAGTRLVTIAGALNGRAIRGTASDGTSAGRIVLRSLADRVHERRFLIGIPGSSGEPELLGELAVALSDSGELVGGAWVASASCDLWGCDGDVTAFRESGSTLRFGFRSDDPCSVRSSASLTFDPDTKFYSGTYTLNTCAGPVTATLFAGRTTRTQSDHVSQILQALGRLADDHESGTLLSAPHPSFSPGYLERGNDLADLLGRYNAENAGYSGIEANFNRVSLITTVPEPDALPFDLVPLGAVFDEQRRGVPAGETSPVTYVDSIARPGRQWLRPWADEGSGWVVRGSQTEAFDFPFEYRVGPNGLEVPFGTSTEPGSIHVSVGPFGAHFGPLTGHGYGDGKGNLVGFFSASDAELVTLPTLPLPTRAYYGGPGGMLLLDRRPVYASPEPGLVQGISCDVPAPGQYLGDNVHWVLKLSFPAGEGLQLGHLGKIAPGLATELLALGVDTSSCPSPDTGNLLGTGTVPVARGEALAYPQVFARPVPGFPDHFVGGGSYPDRPWAQMEFMFYNGRDDGEACYYDYVPFGLQTAVQNAMTADMLDPASQRYRCPSCPRWSWRAEGRLCMAPSILPKDFSDLYTNLGGWFEKDAAGVASNEIVAFAPIAKDVRTYASTFYASPAVDTLILRRLVNYGCYPWPLPGGIGPGGTICYPAGEILERTPGSLLIKWRDMGFSAVYSGVAYQRAAYILDSSGLKIWWGEFAPTPGGALAPPLLPGTPCDGVTVVCYDHTYHPGY